MLNFMKTPEHDLMLSNGAKVKYRPFLVKEEKILLMSVENNVEQEMVDTLIKTVQTCVDHFRAIMPETSFLPALWYSRISGQGAFLLSRHRFLLRHIKHYDLPMADRLPCCLEC